MLFCMDEQGVAPVLGNQYRDDRVLRGYLARVLPRDSLSSIKPALERLGALAGGDLYRLQLADRLNEPRLTQWDAWGQRMDRIEVSPLWREAERLAVEFGLIATGHERAWGMQARTHQFALAYLFTPSTDLYSCALAMTDGAATALLAADNEALRMRALPHLLSREAATFWTSGQWMTELAGGSDVSRTETVARHDGSAWLLYGRKWFTSAINSQMALTLARPEGNAAGSSGLALFYLETRDVAGRPNALTVDRLKDKLGTRKVPTAELTLNGVPAIPVEGLTHGVRAIAPMLNITRTWNAVSACALMRRGVALARDYAERRFAFGSTLSDKPLHLDTLAGLQAETEAAFHLAFFVAALLGRVEAGAASPEQVMALRLATPLAKLTTGRQVVAVLAEVIEAFGGAGYVEDTGLPALLRDAHVLPIWEGTTNVLALDCLRAAGEGAWRALRREIAVALHSVTDNSLLRVSALIERSLDACDAFVADPVEADARRFALAAGRTLAAAMLAAQAQWSLAAGDPRPQLAAQRFVQHGVAQCFSPAAADSRSLARDLL